MIFSNDIVQLVDMQGVVVVGESSSMDMGAAIKYWRKILPGVVMPTSLHEAVS